MDSMNPVAVQGEHPHRVWNQIYSHSCFQGMSNASECTEQRVFYKLISGIIWWTLHDHGCSHP